MVAIPATTCQQGEGVAAAEIANIASPAPAQKDSLRSMGSCGGIDEVCRLQVDEDGARAVFGSVKPCGFTIVGPASSGICGYD